MWPVSFKISFSLAVNCFLISYYFKNNLSLYYLTIFFHIITWRPRSFHSTYVDNFVYELAKERWRCLFRDIFHMVFSDASETPHSIHTFMRNMNFKKPRRPNKIAPIRRLHMTHASIHYIYTYSTILFTGLFLVLWCRWYRMLSLLAAVLLVHNPRDCLLFLHDIFTGSVG